MGRRVLSSFIPLRAAPNHEAEVTQQKAIPEAKREGQPTEQYKSVLRKIKSQSRTLWRSALFGHAYRALNTQLFHACFQSFGVDVEEQGRAGWTAYPASCAAQGR